MNISLSEMILVLLVALIAIRPEQMPEVAAMLGRLARLVRSLSANIKSEVNALIHSSENSDERQQ